MNQIISLKQLSFYFFIIFISACSSFSSLQKKYTSQKDYWEKEVSELIALDSKESYPDNAILFIGSSSIRMWKSIHEQMKPYAAIRRGYGGASYSDLIHFTERLVSPHKIAGIGIFVANDIRAQPDDKDPKEVLALFQEVVRLSRIHHPSIPIFSIAVTPTPSRWKAWQKINEANLLIKDYCEKTQNLYFIDTVDAFLTKDTHEPDTSLFINDMLHQNAKGYVLWSTIIKSEIAKIIKEH